MTPERQAELIKQADALLKSPGAGAILLGILREVVQDELPEYEVKTLSDAVDAYKLKAKGPTTPVPAPIVPIAPPAPAKATPPPTFAIKPERNPLGGNDDSTKIHATSAGATRCIMRLLRRPKDSTAAFWNSSLDNGLSADGFTVTLLGAKQAGNYEISVTFFYADGTNQAIPLTIIKL